MDLVLKIFFLKEFLVLKKSIKDFLLKKIFHPSSGVDPISYLISNSDLFRKSFDLTFFEKKSDKVKS